MKYEEFTTTPLMFYNDVNLLYNDMNIKIRIVENSVEHCPPYHAPIHSYKAIAIGTDSTLNNFTIPNQGSSPYMPVTSNLLISGGDMVIPCYVDSFSVTTPHIDVSTMSGPFRLAPMIKECEIWFHIDETCFDDFPITKRRFNTKKEKTFTPFDRFDILDFDE